MRLIVAFVGIFLLVGLAYSFAAPDDAYRDGYAAGFHFGQEDMRAGADFDFTRDAYLNRDDCGYKVGYAEGYTDGFYGRGPRANMDRDFRPRYRSEYEAGYRPGDSESDVLAYTDKGYTGEAKDFVIGRYPMMPEHWDDRIQSLQVNGHLRVILFDKKNFEGKSIVIDGSTPDLGHFRKKAASMIIERY